jgi:hypothetical protein
MKALSFIILCVFVASLFATPRGLTVSEIPCSDIISSRAIPVDEFISVPPPAASQYQSRDEWFPALELDLNTRLGAKQQYGLQFDLLSNAAIPFGSMGVLSPEGKQAVAKAPSWMQAELTAVLSALDPAQQTLWANLILDTEDPFVDEIAFCIANASVPYLNSEVALPQLFTENAFYIYDIDSQLDYVEVLDFGSAAAGGDYYSTTRYFKKDANGQTLQVTVPKELYYWYIVHPKLSDEIAAYIDPAIVESNSTHYNNIADPPLGKFWRQYIFNLDQGDYPVLADTLSQCQTLFNRDGSGNDAIRAIQWWINQNMSFTSNSERPHQPVRIITKRIGRCGEYADLTSAIARLALIPCTSILSVSTDHVWNEFWDEDWVAWEPVNGYINNPLVYENGWGKVFGSVFEIRSDGLFTPVTDRYSEESALIQIQVVDNDSQPVDGARVVLAILDNGNRFDCEQYTDNSGIASFIVGEGRNYRARVESDFGIYPDNPGTYTQLIENAEDGQTYQYILTIDAAMPIPMPTEVNPPEDPMDDHRIAVSFQSPGYYVSSITLWDDISNLGPRPSNHRYMADPSDAAFMVMDADSIIFWQLLGEGSASNYISPANGGSALFDIPIGQNWYVFMDNSHRHRNSVKLSGGMIYERYGTENQDAHATPPAFKLLSRYPNPFKQSVQLSLELIKESPLQVDIFNLKGQLVNSWTTSLRHKGHTEILWNGRSKSGNKLASGIYFIKISDGVHTQACKVVFAD